MVEDWMHLFVIIAGYRTECSGVMGQILFPWLAYIIESGGFDIEAKSARYQVCLGKRTGK